VTIEPSQDGIGPDIESLSLALTQELKDPSSDRAVELRTSRRTPEITTEKARSMGIKERISTYTTTYESGNQPRVNNIHLLGDSLDGALVKPGGVFSFNGTAGERTAEKGYQEANAIVNGRLVPQLGGGVCQVGTTIFNAVFESGLPVIERRNHSFYIAHYPKGRDATVSWGGPDFKFKNDTENWVLVSVSYTNGSITISLYGTDPGYDVAAETGSWTNERPFTVEEIKDPELTQGSRVVEDGGVSGRSITVKRIVSKSGKVVRTDTFVSNYKPKTQVVRVGTKKRAGSKSATVTP
jgi:vancomycin resistance protein YoaR